MVRRGCWWAAPLVRSLFVWRSTGRRWSYYGAALVACALLFDLCESGVRRWPRVTVCALLAALVVPVAEATSIPMSLAAVVRLVLVAASAALAVGRRGAADSRIGVDELCQNATPTAASSVDRITMATINARLSDATR